MSVFQQFFELGNFPMQITSLRLMVFSQVLNISLVLLISRKQLINLVFVVLQLYLVFVELNL